MEETRQWTVEDSIVTFKQAQQMLHVSAEELALLCVTGQLTPRAVGDYASGGLVQFRYGDVCDFPMANFTAWGERHKQRGGGTVSTEPDGAMWTSD